MGGASSAMSVAGATTIASCTCSLPNVAPLLYFLGENALAVSKVISAIARYQTILVSVIVMIDVGLIYLYLVLISRCQLIFGGQSDV